MALVVDRYQYALPAFTGQLSADLYTAGVYNKVRRQLTSNVPISADLIEQCYNHLFQTVINPMHCLPNMLPPKKNMYGCNLRKTGQTHLATFRQN